MQQAIDIFHERHSDILLEIDVTRQPYSWAGDATDADLQGKFLQFSNKKNDDGVRAHPPALQERCCKVTTVTLTGVISARTPGTWK